MGKTRSTLQTLTTLGLLPAVAYFAIFVLYTYPAIGHFRTRFFADDGDGFQNVWNLWWVNKAVIELHQSPWHTRFLHWPYGTSLLGHTLNPFNGFLAIPLLRRLTLIEAHNLIVVFSFVVGGLSAFWLAYELTASYAGSLVAGFIFTFSNYHFGHAQGHLQLVSLEWIPLFLLLWWRLLSRPTTRCALATAATLFLVILCDYYYFFYCVVAGLVILLWHVRHTRDALRREPSGWVALGVFVGLAAATSGVLVGALLWLNHTDFLVGAHDPEKFSLDLLAPVIYGAHWRFASLTQPYWSTLPGSLHGSSVHLGLSVLFLLAYAWRKRRDIGCRDVRLLFVLVLGFGVLALGPGLHIWGKRVPHLILPYAWLVHVFHPLRASGVPGRMMVMVFLFSGVISAGSLDLLWRTRGPGRVWACVLVAVLVIEYYPSPIPLSEVPIPDYVHALEAQSSRDAVLDAVSSMGRALLYQTVYDRPMAFGYLARLPVSVFREDRRLAAVLNEGRAAQLWSEFRIRYLLVEAPTPAIKATPGIRTVWSDGQIWLFDLSGTSLSEGSFGG